MESVFFKGEAHGRSTLFQWVGTYTRLYGHQKLNLRSYQKKEKRGHLVRRKWGMEVDLRGEGKVWDK